MSQVNDRVNSQGEGCPVDIEVNCIGETCPVPLVEVRKALRRASPGDVIEVVGTHPASKKEIPMAVTALGLELLSVEGTDTDWTIRIRR
ncbi:MAG TPA: sulfurtransferase TusA family protein [Chloroflexi bacterium]|nr:sulfurtransferase TusA family protein [Chloroflexota bacterium]